MQIQSEVDELPVDPLAAVLLLLVDEHRVIEELLQILICVVYAELLEAVLPVDLEAKRKQRYDDDDSSGVRRHKQRKEKGTNPEMSRIPMNVEVSPIAVLSIVLLSRPTSHLKRRS